MTKVRDIMVRDITALMEDDTMRDAARVLANYRFGGISVVDDDHHVVGFLSERDVVQSEFPQMGRSASYFLIRDFTGMVKRLSNVGKQKVKDFMSTRPITVDEDDTVMDVVRLVLERGVKVVPVVRDGLLVGVVGRAEICRELFDSGNI